MVAVRAAHDAPRRLPQLALELANLASRDEATSSAAATRLTSLCPTADELSALLNERNPFVRSGAAKWMRHIGPLPAAAADALRTAIYDQNPFVVQAALGTTGVLRLEEARKDARSCLEDTNPCIVHAAIFALGRLGPAEEGAHLTHFLQHPEQHVQVAAIAALAGLNYPAAVQPMLELLESACGMRGTQRPQLQLASKLISALGAMGAANAAPLLIRVAREEVGLRGLAVQALIDLKAEEAAPALVPLLEQLRDSSHEERLCCRLLYLMTSSNYRFAMPAVRGFLGHRQPGVRCAALKAVAGWADRDALADVRRVAFEDPSAFVRPVAVAALAELLGREALPLLERLSSDGNALVRGAVATALSELGEEGRHLLSRLMADEAQAVSRAAQEALARLPMPALPDVPVGPAQVPASLRPQADAARAFLKRWLVEGASGPLASALGVVVAALQ
jgi:HEAT repeat protein